MREFFLKFNFLVFKGDKGKDTPSKAGMKTSDKIPSNFFFVVTSVSYQFLRIIEKEAMSLQNFRLEILLP